MHLLVEDREIPSESFNVHVKYTYARISKRQLIVYLVNFHGGRRYQCAPRLLLFKAPVRPNVIPNAL